MRTENGGPARLASLLVAASVASVVAAQTSWTVHVIPGHTTPSGAMGETWDNAYGDVQSALDRVKELAEAPLDQFGFNVEREISIKLAEGIFRPVLGSDIGAEMTVAPATSSVTLDMRGGFKLMNVGGSLIEVGTDGETVLSGDTLGNDDPAVATSYDDNVPVMLIDVDGDITYARVDVARLTFASGRGSVHVIRDQVDEMTAAGLSILANPELRIGQHANVTFSDLSDLRFEGNWSEGRAGGLSLIHNKMVTQHVEFIGNRSTIGVGGYSTVLGLNELRDCTFIENEGWTAGGYQSTYDSYFYGCEFRSNRCVGEADVAGDGGGGASSSRSLVFVDCTFIENHSETLGGAVNSPRLVSMDRCSLAGNVAVLNGGAVYGNAWSDTCLFAGNIAGVSGGAIYQQQLPILYGTTFVDNAAPDGGAIVWRGRHSGSFPISISLLLFSNNSRLGPAIGAVDQAPEHFVMNGVVLSPGDLESLDPSIVAVFEGRSTIGQPVFVDADGPDNDASTFSDNNYSLEVFSVAVDASERAGEGFDLAGALRRVDGDGDGVIEADAGAYEYSGPLPGCPQDFDLDGEVGLGDFLRLLEWYSLGQQRGDIADDFGNPGADGMVSFGDFLALLGYVGACE